jgi:hypothetical protein
MSRTNAMRMRVTLFIVGCLVILLSVWSRFWSDVSRTHLDVKAVGKIKLLNTKNGSSLHNETSSSSSLTNAADATAKMSMYLRPGDLPGYTGWARPSNTLAGSFAITHCDGAGIIQQNWTCTVHCHHHAQCQHGGSLFFVRAYGPAILPGLVTDRGNGTYDVIFLPFDPGLYTIEVVLAFSSHPPWSDFPVEHEPAYEGYLLPGFPLQVSVGVDQQDDNSNHNNMLAPNAAMSRSKTKLRSCNISMLTETSTHSALALGRWVVRKINMQDPYVANQTSSSQEATLERYQMGETSLGIDMEYVPTGCSLMPARAIKDPRTLDSCQERSPEYNNDRNTTTTNRSLHVIFIGDSNFRLQQDMFDRFFGQKLKTTRITTEGGLVVTLPNIQKRLQELAVAATESTGPSAIRTDYFVIFNAGLHDLDKLCQKSWQKYRAQLIHNVSDSDFSCLQLYRESLTELVTAVAAFPARLRVWQSTTAGWPKWGNYGVAWPADAWQVLPTDPTAVAHWNDVAWEVLQPFSKEIAVMDAYWLTLSRPDHRESNRLNSLGKHLVHAGPQVYYVLMRKWAMMILQTICPSAW